MGSIDIIKSLSIALKNLGNIKRKNSFAHRESNQVPQGAKRDAIRCTMRPPTLKLFFKTLNFQIQKNKLRFAASSFGLDWIYLLSVCLSLGLEGLFVCIRLQWLGKREEVRVGDLSVCVH